MGIAGNENSSGTERIIWNYGIWYNGIVVLLIPGNRIQSESLEIFRNFDTKEWDLFWT